MNAHLIVFEVVEALRTSLKLREVRKMARQSAVTRDGRKGLTRVSASHLATLMSLVLSAVGYVFGIRPLLPSYNQGVVDVLLSTLLVMISLRAIYALVKE